jgi:3-oxoacyl-[acyl-carrier-protein] synthase II
VNKRVVITGLGAVSSIGLNYLEFWSSLLSGVSGAKPVTAFDCTGLRRNIGCEVSGFDLCTLAQRDISAFGHASQLVIIAAENALNDAGIDIMSFPSDRIGISVGTTMGEFAFIEQADSNTYIQADAISASLAHYFGVFGPRITWQTACAAGNYAFDGAWKIIERGDAEIVIAGGSDSFSRTAFIGFAAVGALSPDICRPFDKNRQGLLLGSGAGILIFESLEHAQQRGVRI